MSECMWTKSNTVNTNLIPEYLEIPFKVPNGDLRIVLCSKNIAFWNTLKMTEDRFTELGTKGYKTMFSAFTMDSKYQVIQIYILGRESKHLTGPKSGIKNR